MSYPQNNYTPTYNAPSGPPPLPSHSYPGSAPPGAQPGYGAPPGPLSTGYNPAYPTQGLQYTPPSGGPPQQYYSSPTGPSPSSYPPPPVAPSGYHSVAYPLGPSGFSIPPGSGYYPPPAGAPPSIPTDFSQYAPQYLPQNYQVAATESTIVEYLGAQVGTPALTNNPRIFEFASGVDVTRVVKQIVEATRGFGTKDVKLIEVLVSLYPVQMQAAAFAYKSQMGKDLLQVISSETSGYYRDGLKGLILGPIGYDISLLDDAVRGLGTKELILTEILIGRSNDEIRFLKEAFRYMKNKSLEDVVLSDVSGKTKQLFTMALNLARSSEYTQFTREDVLNDVKALYKAGEKKIGTDESAFFNILFNRSYRQLKEVFAEYGRAHKRFKVVIKSEFSGHQRDILLHLVRGVMSKNNEMDGVRRDAKLLEMSMKGMGTKDALLVMRILRGQWNPARFDAIKRVYNLKYRQTLAHRVSGETSGQYQRLMVSIIEKSDRPL